MPAVQETLVPSLGQEDPTEQEMALHSSILAWRILWTEEPGGLYSIGLQESDTATKPPHKYYFSIGILHVSRRQKEQQQQQTHMQT